MIGAPGKIRRPIKATTASGRLGFSAVRRALGVRRLDPGHSTTHITRAGFTLFEVLAVVAVLAVLVSVAIPALRSSHAQTLESAARVLAADLRLARSLAIRDNSTWAVRFSSAENAYELVHTGAGTPPSPRDPLRGDSKSGTYHVALDDVGTGVRLAGAQLKTSGAAVADITFGPTGGTGPHRNSDTFVWLTAGSGHDARFVRLTVSWITGQVWIDSPQMFGK